MVFVTADRYFPTNEDTQKSRKSLGRVKTVSLRVYKLPPNDGNTQEAFLGCNTFNLVMYKGQHSISQSRQPTFHNTHAISFAVFTTSAILSRRPIASLST